MTATIIEPGTADGGRAAAAHNKLQALRNWHRHGQVTVPVDLQGFTAGQKTSAWNCCCCGGVEITEYAWQNNHGCCTSTVPHCSRPGVAERSQGWAGHWNTVVAKPTLPILTQPGSVRIDDVVCLFGQRQLIRVATIDVKASAPTIMILSDRHGNSIQVDASRVHTLELLTRGSVTQPMLRASAARSVHAYIHLTEDITRCGQCGGGNYLYHTNVQYHPGWQVPRLRPPGVQPVADPGTREGFRDLVGKGVLIDMEGHTLTFFDCLCGRGKVSGETCPIEVRCPLCEVRKGKKCESTDGSYHKVREELAVLEMAARRAAGDLTVPAPWPGQAKKEAATVTAATTTTTTPAAATKAIRWNSYKGTTAVPGSDLKPGEQIRCPVSGCDRRAKIRRDGAVAAHKMYGSQTCRSVGEKIPADVAVDVLSRREAQVAEASAAAQQDLDGMAELFSAMLTGTTVDDAAAAASAPDTTPPPRVYDHTEQQTYGKAKRHMAGAREMRIDEVYAAMQSRGEDGLPHDFVMASEGPGIPARKVWGIEPITEPGNASADGTRRYAVHTMIDGERGATSGRYQLWGSDKVTIIGGGAQGWGPGLMQLTAKSKVQLKHDGPWMLVKKITWGGVFVKEQKTIIAYSDIYQVRVWDVTYSAPHELNVTRAWDTPEEFYGFDGGDHDFKATHAGAVRCRVCCGNIRAKVHGLKLNVDFQGFEEIREDLMRPAATWQHRAHATELLDRYVRGLPLVRYDRESEVRWTWVCPLSNLRSVDNSQCGGMHLGYATKRGAKAAWLKHAEDAHGGEARRDAWSRVWIGSWDNEAFPVERDIVYDAAGVGKAAKRRAAVKVFEPKCDPSWQRTLDRIKQSGRAVTHIAATRLSQPAVMVTFPEGMTEAKRFAAAVRDGGIPAADVEIIQEGEPGATSTAAAEPQPVVVEALSGLDDMMAALAGEFAQPAASPLDDLMDGLAGMTGGPAVGERVLLTEVPVGTYIEVTGVKNAVRRGYLLEAPRVHTGGWGSSEGCDMALKYTLGEGQMTMGMYSAVYVRATILDAPEAGAPERSGTRPVCAADLRPGDVVDKGALGHKPGAGTATVLTRPVLVSHGEVSLTVSMGGEDLTIRTGRGTYVQVLKAVPFTSGDEMPLKAHSVVPEMSHDDLRAHLLNAKRIMAEYQPGRDPQEMVLWAAGVLRISSAFYLFQSWSSGDQMASYLPKTYAGYGVGNGRYLSMDKGGFTIYADCNGGTDSKKTAEKVTELGWDQVLPLVAMTKVSEALRLRVRDLMIEREVCNPGIGRTAEHISPAPRDGESTSVRTYRGGVEHDLHKLAMLVWASVNPIFFTR